VCGAKIAMKSRHGIDEIYKTVINMTRRSITISSTQRSLLVNIRGRRGE
jgi:hypothetical protein